MSVRTVVGAGDTICSMDLLRGSSQLLLLLLPLNQLDAYEHEPRAGIGLSSSS